MTDWNQLRELSHQVSPPPFESLSTAARQRDRRRRTVGGAAVLTVLSALALGIGLVDDEDSTVQPAEEPAQEDLLPAGVVPLPKTGSGEGAVVLSGGRYRVPLSETLSVDVDLPPGTEANGEGLYLVHDDTVLKVEAAAEGFGVASDPCRGFKDISPAGSTVGDVVRAIRDQMPYRVSRLEPVELGGAAGKHFELGIPSGFDASSCVDGQVGLPGNPGTNNNMKPGYVGQWWILDADGQLAVLQTFCDKCEGEESASLADAVQGITFTATP